MLKNFARCLAAAVMAALFIPPTPVSLPAQSARAAQQQPQQISQRPHKLQNPEAVGLLLNLIARYAEGVPEGDKTEYDTAVANALAGDARAKATAQRLIGRLKQKPEAVRALPVEFEGLTARAHPAAKYKLAFSKKFARAPDPDDEVAKTPPPRQPKSISEVILPPVVRIFYRGLKCFVETDDGSASDEPYLITSVVDSNRKVTTVRHPFVGAKSYEGVDANETRAGPEVTIYNGRARDVAVVAVMMEHDFGDPNHWRDEIDLAVKAAAAATTAATGIPIPSEITDVITDFFNWLTGSEDDQVQQVNRFLSKNQLISMANSPLMTTETLRIPSLPPIPNVPAPFRYHFRTRHVGDGGHYQAYYRVVKGG